MDSNIREFLSAIPVTWEDIELIDGYPGEFVIVARESHENVWYIGGINGENEKKQVQFSFNFLVNGKNYLAETFEDQGPTSFKTGMRDINSNDSALVTMLPYGGFVYVIHPK
jgi:hypothetical protein